MSVGVACICAKTREGRKNLVVTKRKYNTSAFNGGHYTSSDYSEVQCNTHHRAWRTKAAYVKDLPDAVEPKPPSIQADHDYAARLADRLPKHSRNGSVRCEICAPLRCSKAP